MNSTSPFSVAGKTVLITGAAQGIGLTLAQTFAREGANLLLNDSNENALGLAAGGLPSGNGFVRTVAFDVAVEAAVADGVTRLLDKIPVVDVLINNAGIHRRAPLLEMSLADWQRVLDVNLSSAFLLARAVVPTMCRQRAGKIINICSLNCEIVRPNIANYAAAKGGLKMLTRAMAVEWGGYNIQANGLGPGYLLTELTKDLAADPDFDRWVKTRTPAGRWGRAEDLSGPALFLASQASDFMTGQILYIDGGMLAAF